MKDTANADVKVDAKYHKHIIGKGGSTINKIKSETDVIIIIPDTDSGTTVIRIEGNKAGVEKAKAELALCWRRWRTRSRSSSAKSRRASWPRAAPARTR